HSRSRGSACTPPADGELRSCRRPACTPPADARHSWSRAGAPSRSSPRSHTRSASGSSPPCKGPSRSRTGKPAAQPARTDFACNCGKPRPSATSSQPPRPQPYIPSIELASLFASHRLESRSACLHRLVKLLMCQGTRLDSTIWVTSVEWKKYTGCGFLKRFNITATLCHHPMLIVIWWRPEGSTNGGSRQGRLWRVNGSYGGKFNGFQTV